MLGDVAKAGIKPLLGKPVSAVVKGTSWNPLAGPGPLPGKVVSSFRASTVFVRARAWADRLDGQRKEERLLSRFPAIGGNSRALRLGWMLLE